MKHFSHQIAIALFSAVATDAFAAAEHGAEQRVEITAPSYPSRGLRRRPRS